MAGCASDDAIPAHLRDRLKSFVTPRRSDLSPDDVEQALARQLRTAPVPAGGVSHAANPAFPTRETLERFYERNGHRLAWCDDAGKIVASSRTLLNALRRTSSRRRSERAR